MLPSRLPLLLLNGAGGIAVGIATKIPPHNMRELVAGLKALIADPDITSGELMAYIPAPDFPTGGQIMVNEGIREAYETGRGTITVRAKAHIEDGTASNGKGGGSKSGSKGNGKTLVVITELPYQVYKVGQGGARGVRCLPGNGPAVAPWQPLRMALAAERVVVL